MIFKLLLEELLNEATPEEIYQKYYSDIDQRTFTRIIAIDPGSIVDDRLTIKRIGKYSKLLLKLHRENELKLEDYPKAKQYLGIVYKSKIPLDINSVSSLSDLYNIVKDKIAKSQNDLSTIFSLLEQSEYRVVHNGDEWIIVIPKNQKAASYLGVNTEWCTTWGDYCLNPDYKTRTSHFKSHNSQGPLYIIINKENENDKYQLHFESNQFKNPADSEINRNDFFEKNKEVLKALFPAIFEEDPSEDDIKETLGKSGFIPKEYITELIKKLTGNTDNPLILSLLNRNDGMFEQFFDLNGVEDYEIKTDSLKLTFKRYSGNLSGVNDCVNTLRSIRDNAWDEIYNMEENRDDDEWQQDLEGYLESYYNKNKQSLNSFYGKLASNFERFNSYFGQSVYRNEKIREKYSNYFIDATSSSLQNAADAEISEISKHIDVDSSYWGSSVYINIPHLITYISEKNIVRVSDAIALVNDYIEHYDVPTEYNEYPEYQYEYPTSEQMYDVINDYFENLEDESEFVDKDDLDYEESMKCIKTKKELLSIMEKYFNMAEDNSDVFENEHVVVRIKSPWLNEFDCEKGIRIEFVNKDKGTKYNGYVQIENLPKYISNHPLYESKLKLRNLIP